MRRKSLYMVLGAEAVLLAALSLSHNLLPEVFSALAAFPFEQIAWGLRILSQSGAVGSACAWTITVGLVLAVLVPVMRRGFARPYRAESVALCAVAAEIGAVLWCMMNPAVPANAFGAASEDFLGIYNAILGGTVWATAVCWLILRLLRLFREGDKMQLFGYLRVLLYALCALFTGVIATSGVTGLAEGFQTLQRPADGLMTVLRFLVGVLPYVLDIAVTVTALSLLDELLADPRGDAVVSAADRLSKVCGSTLAVVVIATAVMNVLQLLMAGAVSDIHASVELPVLSITFVIAAHLCARLIAENKHLADENDAFI